jgi:pimeloyl-ACP methyl ester carboxylesterase
MDTGERKMNTMIKIVKKILLGLGMLIGLFVLYLFVLAIIPGFSAPPQPLQRPVQPIHTDAKLSVAKKEISFTVEGTLISAWLYLPKDLSAPVPAVVMAAGAAGTKEIGMEPYAVHFQEAGFAVLAFDYRYWGESGGEPRQLIWILDQLEDYAAAIAYVRSLKEVDPERVSLWGTSFGGGHVISTAAEDQRIICAVAQVPFVDGLAAYQMHTETDEPVSVSILTMMYAQRDLVRSWLGLSPSTIPIVGEAGSVALMTGADVYDFFSANIPENYANETPARITIRADKYRPILRVQEIHHPVLFQIADDDKFVSNEAVEEAARLLGNLAQVKHYPIGHFDIYTGENFEKSVSDQVNFLQACIGATE